MRTQKVPVRGTLLEVRRELRAAKQATVRVDGLIAHANQTESDRARGRYLKGAGTESRRAQLLISAALDRLDGFLLNNLIPDEVTVEIPEVVLVEEEK